MSRIYKRSSLNELMELINPSQPIFLDTETSKLGSQIRLVQCYQEDWQQVLLFDTAEGDSLPGIWAILEDKHLVGHNLWYDFQCLKADLPAGVFTMPKNWDDTFYLSRLVYPEWNIKSGYSLDKALTNILGYDPYAKEGLNKKQLQMSFERLMVKGEYIEGPEGLKELTEEQLLYASIDVYELPHLYKAVKHKIDHFVYKLDKLALSTIAKDTVGMPVDPEELGKLEQADISNIASIKKQIGSLNVNSYMQVRKALGTILSSDEMSLQIIQHRPGGLTDLWSRVTMTNGKWAKALREGIDNRTILCEKREFGNPSAITHSSNLPDSNKVLVYIKEIQYQHTDEVVKLAYNINSMRKSLKRLNFVQRARIAMNKDNRITAHYSPHAINGRIQQENENLTQFPRAMKSMWGFPQSSDRRLMYCDFAQIELRIICAALPEMSMYKALKEGTDLHSYVANNFNFSEREIAMLPAGQNPRQVAKQSNFLLLYGGGATNFQRVVCRNSGVWFEDSMSKGIVDKWKNIFPDIKSWHTKNASSKTRGDVTVCGRPYTAKLVTDLNNIKVSGTGAEVFKLWLWYIDKYLMPKYPNSFIVNRVHDSVTIDVVNNPVIYKPMAELLAKLAQKAWFEVIKLAPLPDVPMPVDVAVGWNIAGIEYGTGVDYSFNLDSYFMLDKNIEDVICG